MRTLTELKEISPYPVHFGLMDLGFWSDEPTGQFNHILKRIEISKAGTPAEKFAVLSHEIGHASCYKKGCFCSKKIGNAGEYHAFKAGLLGCADYKEALLFTVSIIRQCASDKMGESCHTKAARRVVKTKLYAEACLRSA